MFIKVNESSFKNNIKTNKVLQHDVAVKVIDPGGIPKNI